MAATPSYARRRLGAELRKLREATGLSHQRVAAECGWDGSKISRIENAKVTLSRHDLYRLGHVYNVDDSELGVLEGWLDDSRGPRWWSEFRSVLNASYEEYISLESQSTRIVTGNSAAIPGILQSRSYALAAVTASALVTDPEDAAALVDVRMRRQKILAGESPVEYTAILSAALLYMQTGGPSVLREQLLHLLEQSELPNVAIHVLPFESRVLINMGAVSILDFPGPRNPSVVYIEFHDGALFKDADRDVRRYRRGMEHTLTSTLSVKDSRALITARLDELP
ncbi:helix-turn-helix domain-containing protein [Embleya sp. NBC_00896]|uniref:helix-turn-helix domain-containing protein n=1 Tax=Embleya sp. NBC_00896 TaxID=2975961 RepID=UPI00386746D4|nr:helix-turn-helix domain-containing protein [Embleya sp. NBC_00896]